MKVRGKETREVLVDVDPHEVISSLLKEELGKIPCLKTYQGEYDTVRIRISEEGKLTEAYIDRGYDWGHYQRDSKILHEIDRTSEFDKEYINYLKGLKLVNDWYWKNT